MNAVSLLPESCYFIYNHFTKTKMEILLVNILHIAQAIKKKLPHFAFNCLVCLATRLAILRSRIIINVRLLSSAQDFAFLLLFSIEMPTIHVCCAYMLYTLALNTFNFTISNSNFDIFSRLSQPQ